MGKGERLNQDYGSIHLPMKICSDLNLHEKCTGCLRIVNTLCSTYLEPTLHWRGDRLCPFHPKTMEIIIARHKTDPKFYDPLKASKRRAKGK